MADISFKFPPKSCENVNLSEQKDKEKNLSGLTFGPGTKNRSSITAGLSVTFAVVLSES